MWPIVCLVKSCWNTDTPGSVHTACGCWCTIAAELSHCYRDHMPAKPTTVTSWPFTGNVCQPFLRCAWSRWVFYLYPWFPSDKLDRTVNPEKWLLHFLDWNLESETHLMSVLVLRIHLQSHCKSSLRRWSLILHLVLERGLDTLWHASEKQNSAEVIFCDFRTRAWKGIVVFILVALS